MTKEIFTGAQILLKSLVKEGVKEIFGYPGGVILTVYEALYNQKEIKHYLVRHEQAAVHAAEGYARVTGKPGVVLVTSGPGACNTVTGIANAYYDGYPIVVFTGQVGLNQIGNDAFQEADMVGITRSCCKHNYLVKDVKDLQRIIKEAFHIATTGKPGPVVVDLPKDILTAKTTFNYPETIKLAGYNPNYKGHPIQISKALKVLAEAHRPVIIAGGGVLTSGAENELLQISNLLKTPVAHTLMGTGTFPSNSPLDLGMLGMHGAFWANHAVSHADAIFALGTRFNDRITGCLSRFARNAQVIHVDIDPCSISKNVKADIPIVGDVKNVLEGMIAEFEKKNPNIRENDKDKWLKEIEGWRSKKADRTCPSGKLSAVCVINKLYEMTKDKNPIVCTEVGQHQMWTAQLFKFNKSRHFVTSGGLGTMGFGFPAAMGACAARPNDIVLNIAGDGSIQMNIQEMATCIDYGFKVINCVIDNGYLGMVRQWQEKLFNQHYSETKISHPDFVKLAEAYGALGIRVEREDEIEPAIKRALEADKPVIIDFITESKEMVYPWVLAGEPLTKVLLSNNCEAN